MQVKTLCYPGHGAHSLIQADEHLCTTLLAGLMLVQQVVPVQYLSLVAFQRHTPELIEGSSRDGDGRDVVADIHILLPPFAGNDSVAFLGDPLLRRQLSKKRIASRE